MGVYHLPSTAVQIHATLSPGVVLRRSTPSYITHLTQKLQQIN
jgi:hypothetical protein